MKSQYQLVANFILSELVGLCNKNNVDINNITVRPEQISKLITYIDKGKISSKQAKDILNDLWSKTRLILMKSYKIKILNKYQIKIFLQKKLKKYWKSILKKFKIIKMEKTS